MQSFDWRPDHAEFLGEKPIEARFEMGDGYEQVSKKGLTRTWQVRFHSYEALDLRRILQAIEKGRRFIWIQPEPYASQGERPAEAVNVSSMGINGKLTEIAAEFRVTLLGPQFAI